MAWNHSMVLRLVVASLPLAAVWIPPREASACSPDPCAGSDRFHSVHLLTPAVPAGGLLVFSGYRGAAASLTATDLEVVSLQVQLDTEVLSGQLEPIDSFGGFLWRPDAPLPASSTLDIVLTIDNTQFGGNAECSEDLVSIDTTVSTTATEAPPPMAPAVTSLETVHPQIDFSLQTIVCCDGAYPTAEPYCGAEEILWSEGYCVSYQETGRLSAGLSVDEPLSTAATANMLYRTILDDDTASGYLHQPIGFDLWQQSPFCVRVEALSLVTGETHLGDEMCLGDDVADQLGPQYVDPTEDLAANCEGEPYTCNVIEDGLGSSWDSEDCMPFDGEPPDTSGSGSGSGSDSGGDGSGGTGDTTGGTDGGTGGSSAGAEDDSGGCACSTSTGPRSDVVWASVLLLGLLHRRRRAKDRAALQA